MLRWLKRRGSANMWATAVNSTTLVCGSLWGRLLVNGEERRSRAAHGAGSLG
jgi:hypothetical protein